MTIYYIDPHTTVNGTGTWVSPWSLASTTRTGLASGDEIRIKGVALTSLLTATSYTATYASQNTMTITAGGGLGADFPVGTIAYFPAYDVFARVTAVTTNTLTFGTGVMPWYNTTAGQTSIVIRKVNSTTYPAGSGATNSYIFSDALTACNNITVSDCWTSETTRVTDGSVKTLVYSSSTATSFTANLNTSSGADFTGCVYNLNNTHILGGSGSASGVMLQIFGSNSTATIKQICSQNSASAVIAISTTGYRSKNITLTINDLCSYSGIGASINAVDGLTINVTNLAAYNADSILGNSTSSFWYAENVTINIANIVGFTQGYGAVVFKSNTSTKNLQLNLNGIIDIYSSGAPSYIIYTNNAGQIEVSFGASFVLYRNRRGSTITTASVGVQLGSPPNMNCYVPSLSVPSGWTTPATLYSIIGYFSNAYLNIITPFKNTPAIYRISTPTTPPDATLIVLGQGSINALLVPRNGSSPVEYLCTNGNGSATTANYFPQVTTDATVYRTAAPSLKSYLATWINTLWVGTNAIKNIKIPVVSGRSYTVTGYIRTDDTTYVNGDCFVSIEKEGAQLDVQNMTTSCINAWEQFTLTFTASQTCEVNLVWGMFYRNGAKSYWLSDLAIS